MKTFVLGLLLFAACIGNEPTSPRPGEERYRLAYFRYEDEQGPIGPETRGDLRLWVYALNDTSAAYRMSSDSGLLVLGVGPDGDDQWFLLAYPGGYEGFWKVRGDSVWWQGRNSGWLGLAPWRRFRADSLVAEWDSSQAAYPWRLHARFEALP